MKLFYFLVLITVLSSCGTIHPTIQAHSYQFDASCVDARGFDVNKTKRVYSGAVGATYVFKQGQVTALANPDGFIGVQTTLYIKNKKKRRIWCP